jgi:ferredoxin
MENLILAFVVVLVILGGPFTLFAAIKLLNSALGSVKGRFVRLKPQAEGDPKLGLFVSWDPETFDWEIFRVRAEFQELVRGGRSTSFSFTFEGKAAKKRSFLIPMKLTDDDFTLLTDGGVDGSPRSLSEAYVSLEIENTKGETVRQKIGKQAIRAALAGAPLIPDNTIDALPPRAPDEWSLQTRVFPWKKVVAEAAAAPAAGEHKAAAPKEKKGPTLVDFLVTKVWIEPGCIVCDACENEAPDVFHVLADTCIVRENAPLDDGAAIKAAAEGCPVNVIKFDTKPKSA